MLRIDNTLKYVELPMTLPRKQITWANEENVKELVRRQIKFSAAVGNIRNNIRKGDRVSQ